MKCGCGCKAGKPAAGCKCTCASCAAARDKKQDAKVMKGMTPKQKGAFEKADKKMDAKKPSLKQMPRWIRRLPRRLRSKK